MSTLHPRVHDRAPHDPSPLSVLCARLRMPLVWAGLALLLGWTFDGVPHWLALAVFALGMALYLWVGTVHAEPVDVAAPVRGRWLPCNSPADRVPSHGLHAYGQTYAIDLVHEPEAGQRPRSAWWPLARRPEDYPAFGQPVHAVADGVVVRTHDRQRDHWSRTSWLSLPYLLVESAVRELLGPRRIVGNHVVVELDDGVCALFAHLRRRSVRVRVGQRVHSGETLAACGSSGNTTEPHLHFHLMDRPGLGLAAGLPFRFHRYDTAAGPQARSVPAGGEPFTVPDAPSTPATPAPPTAPASPASPAASALPTTPTTPIAPAPPAAPAAPAAPAGR
jgi:hypothetical protein